MLSHIWLYPWSVACQAPLSSGFPRQEYWSGWPFPSPGDLPDAGLEPRSPAIQADSLQIYGFFTESPGKPYVTINLHNVIMVLLSLSNIRMSRVFILCVCVCVCFWQVGVEGTLHIILFMVLRCANDKPSDWFSAVGNYRYTTMRIYTVIKMGSMDFLFNCRGAIERCLVHLS